LLECNANPGGQILFVVSVEECKHSDSPQTDRDQETVETGYHLTQREKEIVSNVCDGLRNSAIARKLYISETTVKKHIQNIFDKMGLSSRSALISKVLR
jgi:DNA-binding NarL/FixJ family response regulator